MALANTIRQLRFHHGEMTQKELAKFVGVSRQTINAIEGGKYPPSMEVTFRIANILCTPLENVFFYEPDIEGENEYAAGIVIEVPLDGDGDDEDGHQSRHLHARLNLSVRLSVLIRLWRFFTHTQRR